MIRSWLENEKDAIACALSSGQLFRLPDSAPYFLRQCFLSASSYSTREIQIVPRIYTLLNDSKDDAAYRHTERVLYLPVDFIIFYQKNFNCATVDVWCAYNAPHYSLSSWRGSTRPTIVWFSTTLTGRQAALKEVLRREIQGLKV